jgi:hypothetical protein
MSDDKPDDLPISEADIKLLSIQIDPNDPDPNKTVRTILGNMVSHTDATVPLGMSYEQSANYGPGDSSGIVKTVISVTYHGQQHRIAIPSECTLKELYMEISRQVAAFDPNGEICLERQGMATDAW